ncbi:MAG: Mrp/NBP35 family ATP-binding protein [Planctomycetes bacterium]|nr:Mrp/NBP35 family ATP-binding protein [Planctomycetota bacterium]
MTDQNPTEKKLLQALQGVTPPGIPRNVVVLGLVRDVAVTEGNVRVTYQLPPAVATEDAQRHLRGETRTVLGGVAGVESVDVEFTAAAPPTPQNALPGVAHVIAVGAGKGGVGKSTVAALAALGLARAGHKVGLLDADVYGPSLPMITGTRDARPTVNDEGRIVPPVRDGIRIMSMGYLTPPDQAVIWRGPMAQNYVKELLERGAWDGLDYLIVDLPPGTGDIPLTLAQTISLTGAVVVCTPQPLALADAVKALRMYQKLDVEPLGIVENMSYYVCPHCQQRDEIFGHGGAERAAQELGVPFLGAIPLNISIRENGDTGRLLENFTAAQPEVTAALEHFVTHLLQQVAERDKRANIAPRLKISG